CEVQRAAIFRGARCLLCVATSVRFYQRLGLIVEHARLPEWTPHHATIVMPGGMRREIDSMDFAKQWNPGLKNRVSGGWLRIFVTQERYDGGNTAAYLLRRSKTVCSPRSRVTPGNGLLYPDAAVVTEPNRFGPAVVWPYNDCYGNTQIRCFMPGAGTEFASI